MPTERKVEEIAKKLIGDLVRDAIELLFTRNCGSMEIDEDAATEQEMTDDVVAVMIGDDPGCLDPDDAEDAAKINQHINALIELQRETRRETLMEAAEIVRVWRASHGREDLLAAELERRVKEENNG